VADDHGGVWVSAERQPQTGPWQRAARTPSK